MDADGIINKDDSCKDKAEVYDADGQTPVDGVLDGCPTEVADPAENENENETPVVPMSEGGACTLVRSETGFGLAAAMVLFVMLLPLFTIRLSTVKIRSRIKRDLKK